VFGLFLDRPADMPTLLEGQAWGWPPASVKLEAIVRFPWAGGRHPCLDVLAETENTLVGIESKRYEPFRPRCAAVLSEAYWRPVWGDRMGGYARVRDRLRDGTSDFVHLDATQLVKHAFGLRTAALRRQGSFAVRPVLLYLYAEPSQWPDGRAVTLAEIESHRREVVLFSEFVTGDEVAFHAVTYRDLLRAWDSSRVAAVRSHVSAVRGRFDL
jgi:hypothetical protein